MPAFSGAYPNDRPIPMNPLATRDFGGWSRVDGLLARLPVVAAPAAFYAGLPATLTLVPVRANAWPAAVRVGGVVQDGVLVRGDPVRPHLLADELRCGTGSDAGRPVGLVAVIREAGYGLAIETRYDLADNADCYVSLSGRRRLTSVALDLYLWARATARVGSGASAGEH